MRYDIYFSDYERKTVLQLPIIPEEMPPMSRSSNNEEFETYDNGTFNIIEDAGLLTISFNSWLPGKKKNYSFQRVKNIDPDKYINLFNSGMTSKKPIRLLIVRGDGTFVTNDTYSIDSFEWHENRLSNYVYSIGLKRWRDYNA